MHSAKFDNVEVTWLGHASFRITDGSLVVYIDPFVLPDDAELADLILVTHEHFDHCDPDKINMLRKHDTFLIAPKGCIDKAGFGRAIDSDQRVSIGPFMIEAVPAYNTDKFRSPGMPFHPKGLGIGFVLTIAGKRIYHSGDTDFVEEMKDLHDIDAALLPIGGKYTMTAVEAASAAQAFKPKNLIPMHYNSGKYGVDGIEADPIEVAKALVGKGIMVRILEPLV